MGKLQPAPLDISFKLSGNTTQVSKYIDLSQCASLINRRFYRQSLDWAVTGFSLYTEGGEYGSVIIEKLPDTWPCDNAYTKAYHAWREQQDVVVEESGAESAVAKFRDFKIFMDGVHASAGVSANLLPSHQGTPGVTGFLNYGAGGWPIGEWEASQIVLPNVAADGSGSVVDPAEYTMHMVGANTVGTSRGIIDGYSMSRAYPQSPDPVSPDIGHWDNWMGRMTDVGKDNPEILDNATDKNDDLPYDQDSYPGGDAVSDVLQHVDTHRSAVTFANHSKASLRGGVFKCGLIKCSFTIASGTSWYLVAHLAPGSHRGYMAKSGL